MALTIVDFPTLSGSRQSPNRFELWRMANQVAYTSAITKYSQIEEIPGARLRVSMGYDNLEQPDAAIMRAWLMGLGGGARLFRMGALHRPRPRGVASGSPTVNGAGQSGRTLNVTAPVSVAGWLLHDDWIGFNGELHQVAEVINTTGAGTAAIVLTAPMRRSPPNAAAVTLVGATTTWQLLSPEAGGALRAGPNGPRSDFAIDAIEAWDRP